MKKLLFIFCLLCVAIDSKAQSYKLQALFLYNFTKYVEWPISTLQGDVFDIVVVGKKEAGEDLSRYMSGRKVGGHTIKVRTAQNVSDIGNAHLVFVAEESMKQLNDVVKTINKRPILLVTEQSGGTLASGSNIGLIQADGKFTFKVDKKNSEKQGFKVSNQLARMAE